MIRVITAGMVFIGCAVVAAGGPPVTEMVEVRDTFHGTEVVEQYRWLEDWNDPKVKAWSEAQNVYAREHLDQLPDIEAVRARVAEILGASTVSYRSPAYRNGKLFAIKRQPPKQQPFLVVMTSPQDPASAKVLVDPAAIDTEGITTIDWYKPSPDGKLVAVSLSRAGTESGDVHVYDSETGQRVHEIVTRVNGGTAGGDLAWTPDSSGFYYTRYPRKAERPAKDLDFYVQVYFHKLGTSPPTDRYEMGKDLPRIAEIELVMDDASGRLLATVQDGDGGEFAHFLRTENGSWKQFSRFGDKTLQATFGPKNDLYLLTRKDAPRGRLERIAISRLGESVRETFVAEGKDTIVSSFWGAPSVVSTPSRVYVRYQLGGPSEIRVFDHSGKLLRAPDQLPVSSAGGLTLLGDEQLLFANTSYVEPAGWYVYDPRTEKSKKTALSSTSPVDFGDVKIVREFATSKDGTKVPVNIIMPKGTKLDGSNPCVVSGYGGYGVSLSPRFSSALRVLLEQGVIYAVANLRGGGEYGEAWHRAGNLTNKQNVFDDFAGVVKHMCDRGYTSSERLAIRGGSNGGLLMGALMTQHPDLAKAVVSHVGIYDMLRVELSPNGAFNVPEFGTVKDSAQFRALHAYSPYHNVKDGTAYPATLFLTGANDPRVDPMQSRKMTARLQAATGSKPPILLRTSSKSGHGGGTALTERIAQTADVYAFLFDQLGVAYRPVAKATQD